MLYFSCGAAKVYALKNQEGLIIKIKGLLPLPLGRGARTV